MEKNSKSKMSSIVFDKLDSYAAGDAIPSKYREILRHFCKGYDEALRLHGASPVHRRSWATIRELVVA